MKDMRISWGARTFATLVALLVSSPALAQEPETTDTAPAPIPNPPPPPKQEPEPKPEPAPAAAAAPKDDGTPLVGPVERLGPSAFPEPRVRGIRGGSLWMTFHGLQWPYYPKTGIGVSGSAWIDTGFESIKRGNPTEQGIKYW